MPRRLHAERVIVATAVALTGTLLVAQQPAREAASGRLYAIAAAEDSRAMTPDALQTLSIATRDAAPEVQQAAIRALGRLERFSLIPDLLPFLESRVAAIRAEAANALAQALTNVGSEGDVHVTRVADALAAALDRETDASVRPALLKSLGRLPFQNVPARRRTETRLGTVLNGQPSAADAIGALSGLESLYRGWPRPAAPDPAVLSQIDRAFGALRGDDAALAQARRMVLIASMAAGHASAEVIAAGINDPDDQVRRLVLAAAAPPSVADVAAVVTAGLRDRAAMVRYEALRVYGRRFQQTDCEPVRKAAADRAVSVALLAIDLLGDPCTDVQPSIDLLESTAASDDWRRAAHALVSLARRSPARARPVLDKQMAHPRFQVRMYAARAAAALNDADLLMRLANDTDDNVREAALAGLVPMRGHASDEVYIAALARNDYQLVRTAARALQGTSQRKAASEALVASFERITRERRETSRDARIAVLQRLRETGTSEYAKRLGGCLSDFDPRVATECGLMLLEWGARTTPFVAPAAPPPVAPPRAEIAALAGARARITMSTGGVIELALLTNEAPLSVARFARLASAGYYNGLTFHRIVPNFVIQGGSPGANEYVGDGPFMRDEVGLRSHGRGTVGVSTRGRDTGDAQIFVNLVDNTRLDHIYTVFAEVVSGMEVVDAVQEGDVMTKVEILR
jgi:cyclophilin family peptidyl-prolyl cis-trans isomerase/HEAT repeat protein